MIIFIPIKESSIRVPNKNFRLILEETLWERCINKLTDYKVYIDTDSKRIYNKCKQYDHVTCYMRHKDLIGHEVSVVDLIKYFIDEYNIKDPICQIHVTSPFLQVSDINKSFKILEDNKYDSVFSVNRIQKRFWSKEINPINHNPKVLLPTQNLEPWFEENSYLYTFMPKVIKECNNRIGYNSKMIEINYPYNLDIDTEDDWNLVKNIIK